jgi:hypothetical protein
LKLPADAIIDIAASAAKMRFLLLIVITPFLRTEASFYFTPNGAFDLVRTFLLVRLMLTVYGA